MLKLTLFAASAVLASVLTLSVANAAPFAGASTAPVPGLRTGSPVVETITYFRYGYGRRHYYDRPYYGRSYFYGRSYGRRYH
jgi:hypothetical protein